MGRIRAAIESTRKPKRSYRARRRLRLAKQQTDLRFPIYLRIWLPWWSWSAAHVRLRWLLARQRDQAPAREIFTARGGRGAGATSSGRCGAGPGRRVPGGDERRSTLCGADPPRQRRVGEGPPPRPWAWTRSQEGLLWLLGIVALAVAIGTYPIIRRLTKRLEDLRLGVERWGEGDLSVRVKEAGNDEVAFLARRFNHAAERVETLVKTHKSLLANASHELRSPLARIRMGLELMEGESTIVPARKSRATSPTDQLIDEICGQRLDAREKRYRHHRAGRPDRACSRGMRPRPGRAGRGQPGQGHRRRRRPRLRVAQSATCWRRATLQRRSVDGRSHPRNTAPAVVRVGDAGARRRWRNGSGSSSRSNGCPAPASGPAVSAWGALVRSIATRHQGKRPLRKGSRRRRLFVLNIPVHEV